MALDGEDGTPVPNLALEAIVKPVLREVRNSTAFISMKQTFNSNV